MFHFWINCAFLDKNGLIVFNKAMIDIDVLIITININFNY